MPRLTPDQWLEARQAWESDQTMTFAALSGRFDVSIQAISKMAERHGWVKTGRLSSINRAAQIKADVESTINPVVDESTDKKPLPASIDRSTELRSQLIQVHRSEWRKHAKLFPAEEIKADFDLGKKAKISAEMISIRQKGERAAWGMDDEKSESAAIVIERSYGRASRQD